MEAVEEQGDAGAVIFCSQFGADGRMAILWEELFDFSSKKQFYGKQERSERKGNFQEAEDERTGNKPRV
jgi:hypothetical protein